MKKLYSLIAALAAVIFMSSCEPAEYGAWQTWTYYGIYTVNKAKVAPELSDTSFYVKNIDDFNLKTGDRLFLTLQCYYNFYSELSPQWTLLSVGNVIPTYPLSSKDEIDSTVYTTPFLEVVPVDFYQEFYALTWVWQDKQNINLKYRGEKEGAKFAMTVNGVNDEGYVLLELFIDAEESDKETEVLLTFDISNVKDFLSAEEKALLPENGDIKTKIIVKRTVNGVLKPLEIDGNYFL